MAQPKHVPIAREIMTRRLVTLRPDVPIFEAMRTLLRNRVSGAPVVEGDVMVGMLSELDCLKVLASGEFYDDDHSEQGTVRDYMTDGARTVSPEVDVYSLAEYFLHHGVRRLPVVQGSVLLGQISRRDVMRAIEEMGARRVPRKKRYPDYREPIEPGTGISHLHGR